jgi:hypothetical protein
MYTKKSKTRTKRGQHEYRTVRKFGYGGIKSGGHEYRSLKYLVAMPRQTKHPDRVLAILPAGGIRVRRMVFFVGNTARGPDPTI